MLKHLFQTERRLIYVLPDQIIVVDLDTRKEGRIDLPPAVARLGDIRDMPQYTQILAEQLGMHVQKGEGCAIALDGQLVFHSTHGDGEHQSDPEARFIDLVPLHRERIALCHAADGSLVACDRDWYTPIIEQCRTLGVDVSFIFPTVAITLPPLTKKPWAEIAKRFKQESSTWKSADFLDGWAPSKTTPRDETNPQRKESGHRGRFLAELLAISVFILCATVAYQAWDTSPPTTTSGTGASILPAPKTLEANLVTSPTGSGSNIPSSNVPNLEIQRP